MDLFLQLHLPPVVSGAVTQWDCRKTVLSALEGVYQVFYPDCLKAGDKSQDYHIPHLTPFSFIFQKHIKCAVKLSQRKMTAAAESGVPCMLAAKLI